MTLISYPGKSVRSFRAAFAVLGLACVLTACGNSVGQSSVSSLPPTPPSSPTSDSPAAITSSDGLTGYGATGPDWNAHHTPDTRFDPGSAYDPDPALPSYSGHDVYVSVDQQDGRVVSYQMNIPSESIRDAIARVLQELPPDGYVRWRVKQVSCYEVELTSRILGKALAGLAIGEPNSDVLAEFSTIFPNGSTGYKSTDVNTALISPRMGPTSASAGPC